MTPILAPHLGDGGQEDKTRHPTGLCTGSCAFWGKASIPGEHHQRSGWERLSLHLPSANGAASGERRLFQHCESDAYRQTFNPSLNVVVRGDAFGAGEVRDSRRARGRASP